MMSSQIAHERSGHAAEHGVEILILSLDDALIADVETSLEGAYRVHHARSAALAIDVLTERDVGVLISDETMEHVAFQKLASQLREQFPSLIIIGVGERAAAASLIEMVNTGQIYRFLLKPISPGQVRLRVQSAAHQHLALRGGGGVSQPVVASAGLQGLAPEAARPVAEVAAWAEPAVPKSRSWPLPLMIGAAVAVLTAVVVALLLTRAEQPAAPARSAPDGEVAEEPAGAAATGAGLSEVEHLLDAASVALQQQHYIDPVEDNALDHYLAVLEIEPENPEAAEGLDTVAGVLLEQAQSALREDRPDDALMAYSIVQEIRPAHPDLPLVEAAFTDHGRLLIARMNLAVAAEDWTRAREHLDLAAQYLPGDSTEIAAARALLAERLNQFAIAERVALANERMDANSLTVPENDSAKFHLLALDAEYPDHGGVDVGLARLAGIMLERADSALLEEDYGAAERWLAQVQQLGVEQEALGQRREALAAAQSPPAAELEAAPGGEAAVAELEVAPGGEAAVAELGSEPGEAGDAVATDEAPTIENTAPGAADYSETAEPAPDPVRVASTSPAGVDSVAGAGARLDAEPVAVSELEIVRMVEPEYPRRAWVRDIDGWVDLEFTVTETGLTRAIEVTDAQHRGWFDQVAMDAVEQWRFAPEQYGGQPVERRAKVRLQFARDLVPGTSD